MYVVHIAFTPELAKEKANYILFYILGTLESPELYNAFSIQPMNSVYGCYPHYSHLKLTHKLPPLPKLASIALDCYV